MLPSLAIHQGWLRAGALQLAFFLDSWRFAVFLLAQKNQSFLMSPPLGTCGILSAFFQAKITENPSNPAAFL